MTETTGAPESADNASGRPTGPKPPIGPGNAGERPMAAGRQDDSTRARWEREFASCRAILRPYVFEHDGREYVRQGAPEDVSAIYRKLIGIGYARGWLE